jgi:hypothetical protein
LLLLKQDFGRVKGRTGWEDEMNIAYRGFNRIKLFLRFMFVYSPISKGVKRPVSGENGKTLLLGS